MISLPELQQAFIDHITQTKRSKANATFTMHVFADYIQETGLDFLRFKIKQAQEFQSYLVTYTEKGKIKYAKQTVSHAVTTMCQFYTFLKQQNLVVANPFMGVKKVKVVRKLPKDLLSEEQIQTLLTYFARFWEGKTLIEKRQRYKAHVVCEVLYSTGMTIGEARRLKESDIDFDRKVIHVVGQNGGRECLLNDYTAAVLKQFLKVREIIYTGPNYAGGQANLSLLFASKWELSKTINSELKKACTALKLKKVTTSNVKCAVGFHLLRGDCDIRYIQEILGHQELKHTQRYLKVEKRDLKAVLDNYHPRTMKRNHEAV